MIEDVFLDEGELITVGSDGYIKVNSARVIILKIVYVLLMTRSGILTPSTVLT